LHLSSVLVLGSLAERSRQRGKVVDWRLVFGLVSVGCCQFMSANVELAEWGKELKRRECGKQADASAALAAWFVAAAYPDSSSQRLLGQHADASPTDAGCVHGRTGRAIATRV